jgi:hypothetical protein
VVPNQLKLTPSLKELIGKEFIEEIMSRQLSQK